VQNTSGITPCDVKVLVLPAPPEDRSKGGILFTDTAKERDKFAAMRGSVVAKGPNAFADWGSEAAPAVGSHVAYAQYAGKWLRGSDGAEYLIMNDEDVIAQVASNG
jgi:chaperonin GroES